VIVFQAPAEVEQYLLSDFAQTQQMLCIPKIAVRGWKNFVHLEKVS
jgi:hypothetical protein